MADIKDKEARSMNMSHIRGKNTKPEIYIRQLLFRNGYRFRLHVESVPGHPDLWLKKYNTAVFVNGCFWHRHHNCKYAYTPKSNMAFWKKKFDDNRIRDEKIKRLLTEKKIKCLIIWECTIKRMRNNPEVRDVEFQRIREFLTCQETFLEL